MGEIEGEGYRERLNQIPIKPFHVQKVSTWTGAEFDIQLSRSKDICDFLALGIYCLAKAIWVPDDNKIVIRFSNDGFGLKNSCVKMMLDSKCYSIPENALSVQCSVNCPKVVRYMVGKEEVPYLGIIGNILYPNFTAYAAGYFGEYPTYDNIVPKHFNCKDTVTAQRFAYKLLSEECKRYLLV